MNSLATTPLNRLLDKTLLQRLLDYFCSFLQNVSLEIYDSNDNLFFSYEVTTACESSSQSPIQVDNQTVGIIHVKSTRSQENLARFWGLLLSSLAQRQWERRCITQDSLTRYRELALLYHLGEMLGSCLDPTKLAEIVLSEVRQFIRAQSGSLLLAYPPTNQLSVVASYGAEETGGTLTPAASQLIDLVFTTGKSEVIDDACLDPRLMTAAHGQESLLCVPLKSDNRILGVLNLSHKTGDGYFSSGDMKLSEVIAAQAASAFETSRLFKEIENMAYAIILVAGATIDERDTCTAGHSNRVASISLAIAEKLNQLREISPAAKQKLSQIKLQEIEYAALLHDIGKIGVPEAILTKRQRLSPDRMMAIKIRFDFITVTTGQTLTEEFSLLAKLNEAHSVSPEVCQAVKKLAHRTYTDLQGVIQHFLLPEEEEALCVPRGNLIKQEFNQIQTHAEKSYKILKQIPFPAHLHRIPYIAYQHHERLNGSGYPNGLTTEEILLESKIISVADVFEALTASDRPYRAPLCTEKALEILHAEAETGHLDRLVVDTLATLLKEDKEWWNTLNAPLPNSKLRDKFQDVKEESISEQ